MPPKAPPKEYRPYAVTATITREVSFLVDAYSPEAAQAIVEEWIEDGETGTVNSTEIEFDDTFPADGVEQDEFPLNRSRFNPTEYLD